MHSTHTDQLPWDLTDQTGVDHLNVEGEVIEKSASTFRRVFSIDTSFVQLIDAISRRPQESWADARGLVQADLIDGISFLVRGTPRKLKFDHGNHADFFVHYFVVWWEHASNSFRTELKGRLESAIKDSRHSSALYFEMVVLFTYLRKGALVEPPRGGETHDFDVVKKFARYAVEIKTVDRMSGYPFDYAALGRSLMKIYDFVSADKVRWPEFHIQIVYRSKGRRPTSEQLLNVVNRTVADLRSGGNTSASDLWTVRVQPARKWRGMEPSELRRHMQSTGTILHFVPTGGEHDGELSFETTLPWKLSEQVATVMHDAMKRQLPSKREALLWIYLVGAMPFGGLDSEAQNLLVEGSRPNRELRSWATRSEKRMVALHLGGDPLVSIDSNGRCSIQFWNSVNIPPSDRAQEDANVYMQLIGFRPLA